MQNKSEYIQVKNLKKVFERKNQHDLSVLDNISFQVKKGEIVCIIGSSGCGKSTLLRVMSGLDTEYEGQVLIDNEPVVAPSKTRGFVYQEARLFPWMTVEQNIRFVINDEDKSDIEERIHKSIELVGLQGFETSYPKELSGGMAQRVNIARALVNNPDILFLDEPFGALDALTRMQLQNEILSIREKLDNTMLLVTHDIEEAISFADKVVVLSKRPSIIKKIFDIKLNNKTTPINNRKCNNFNDYYDKIWQEFDHEI